MTESNDWFLEDKALDVGTPKDIDENKLNELIKFMRENRVRPSKFFVVGKKQWLRVYGRTVSHGFHRDEFEEIVPPRLERGEILDSFAKLEFIINEIIQAVILKNDLTISGLLLESLISKIDLNQKIRILRDEWKIISDDTYQMLMKLKNIRNILAHSWEFDNATYGKNNTLETNFGQFQQDLKEVWKRLIITYENVQP
ncbi:hypothetical protein J4231_02385, partial [Candidatus Woesearchaeota archaeon]|nr:hypothetical protein [Candidatus Woesearchaeota archaeon]